MSNDLRGRIQKIISGDVMLRVDYLEQLVIAEKLAMLDRIEAALTGYAEPEGRRTADSVLEYHLIRGRVEIATIRKELSGEDK